MGIVGLGLMGGSLARALKALEPAPSVLASSRDPLDLAAARDLGVLDQGFSEPEGVMDQARTVILAVPLGGVQRLMQEHAARLRDKALVMDVAGLKAPVLHQARAVEITDRFVGAHPMTGGEGSGFQGSRGDLFPGSVVWLTHQEADASVQEAARAFWTGLGATPRWTDAEGHDEVMAWCSHLPQLVSNALAGALDSAGYTPDDLGPGGRDMIRLSGSSPEMWRDLLQRSAPQVGLGLQSVSRALQVLADLLARRDLDAVAAFMERTRGWRGEGPWS